MALGWQTASKRNVELERGWTIIQIEHDNYVNLLQFDTFLAVTLEESEYTHVYMYGKFKSLLKSTTREQFQILVIFETSNQSDEETFLKQHKDNDKYRDKDREIQRETLETRELWPLKLVTPCENVW